MEVVLLAAGLNTLFPRLWDGRKEKKKRRSAIEINISAIKRERNRLEAALENAKFKGDGSSTAMELKREARELSQETRDCIQRFFKDKKASFTEFANNTEEKAKAIQALSSRIEGYSPRDQKAPEHPAGPHVDNPMRMDGPVEELLDLVRIPDGRRKVISIVGFPGLGKTFLANQVYHELTECSLRVWVTAAAMEANQVLREILRQLGIESEHENHDLKKLGEILAQHLRGKRYIVVIDDIQRREQWDGMSCAFPKDVDGTIIVTTTIQSVANVCSSCGNGYVYRLSPLDKDKSLDLFLNERPLWVRDLIEDNASDILKKCDGLPLAIVSMSRILQEKPTGPTSDACRDACRTLGHSLLKENDVLKRMRWVLMNKYTGLSGDAIRSCLLYYCLYKHQMDAVPRRNSLIRRWEAEGFLVTNGISSATDVAASYLNTLVDRNIIQSMEVGENGSTRRCRPPGMMVEYISHISLSEDFAACVCDTVEKPTKVIRRLSFHPGSATVDNRISGMNLKDVLTLAVSGNGCEAILDFKKYDLITVLDLKECTNLEPRHVKYICKLLLLKYLSLGKTIEKIPRVIEKLKLLETLEMRTAKVVIVYEEVLKLPNLKHLFGNFKLNVKPGNGLKKFLSDKSELVTITGFVSDTAQGFPQLMQHMKKLRKVKIYCAPTASQTDQEDLQMEIKAFTRQSMNVMGCDRSLSIDFAEFTEGTRDEVMYDRSLSEQLAESSIQERCSPLEFLTEDGKLDSLKLRGDWRPFLPGNRHGWTIPDFTKIAGIKKLCLSRTCLSGEELLASLTNLIALEYLKLDEQVLGPLEIKKQPGTFRKLMGLCLVGETSLQGIIIQHNALPSLESLHLICKGLDLGLESSIEGVQPLKEIALDSEVHRDIKSAWKTAAKVHPNRPQVLLIKKGTPIRQA